VFGAGLIFVVLDLNGEWYVGRMLKRMMTPMTAIAAISVLTATGLVMTATSAVAGPETRFGCKATFYAYDADQGGGTAYSSCPNLPNNRLHAVQIFCAGSPSMGNWVRRGVLSTAHCAGGQKATAAYVHSITT
jgi:hypothetical protein